MAYIKYLSQEEIPENQRVNDTDNIIQIHGVHGKVMKGHYDLYIEVMRKRSPLSRIQREQIAVAVEMEIGRDRIISAPVKSAVR